MNNEVKAKEIAEMSQYLSDFPHHKKSVKYGAMEMAQWKDEQFYKFLLWLDDNFVIKRFTDGEPMTYGDLVDNFENKSYERDTTKTD